jgi:CheY-like chemotaxis protein
MVEGVVINHGGSLAVQSQKDRGTTFDIFLPALSEVKRIEKPRSIQPPARPADLNRTYTVLLVDDERVLRSTGQRLLKTLGYEVLLAENGARAIQVFKEHQETIDLVILDLAMPVMDGPECFKRLQKLKPTSRIIIASGVTHGYITDKLLERGARGFLRKPYTLEHLKRAVARALDVLPENPPI